MLHVDVRIVQHLICHEVMVIELMYRGPFAGLPTNLKAHW